MPEEFINVPKKGGGTLRIEKAQGFDREHLTQIANQGGWDIFENSPSDRVYRRGGHITQKEISDFFERTGL